ncbi:VanW family protein [Actinotalea sp. M2MS4P-6]|uniref:VanW family protein n=1 Tax=Actinotalea sp. M2MS4P-6 TaxID=2983762 RepID=UPI0021E3765D|nr:VanW family protein [Actinotalea sp. M2MS4P-6]MCV2393776.1 VanW family protein [Actinotalea sp. M2MS4P-6]
MAIGVPVRARAVLGSGVRRARREWQWWRAGGLQLRRAEPDGFGHLVAEHATPLFRTLSGLDDDLQRGKVVNLRLATARLDGLVLEPGQRLSFWYQVRRPTRRRGFVDGLVLDHGRLTAGTGGGLCQATNLLYWLTLHTPLEIAERWRHSYDVFPDSNRTQPFGSGATCAWPTLDLQVVNPTSARFRLALRVTETELVGQWWSDRPTGLSYQVYEAAHVIEPRPDGAFVRRNLLRRRTFDAHGSELADEVVAANEALMRYRPYLPSRAEAGPGTPEDVGRA